MNVQKGARKIISQKWALWSILGVLAAYIGACVFVGEKPDAMVVAAGLGGLGLDAAVFKAANALGDHGAFKKEPTGNNWGGDV